MTPLGLDSAHQAPSSPGPSLVWGQQQCPGPGHLALIPAGQVLPSHSAVPPEGGPPRPGPLVPRAGFCPWCHVLLGQTGHTPAAAAADSLSYAGGAAQPVSGWGPTSRHQSQARRGVPATLPSLPCPPPQQSRVPGSLARAEPQPQQEHRQRLGDGLRRVLTCLRGRVHRCQPCAPLRGGRGVGREGAAPEWQPLPLHRSCCVSWARGSPALLRV